MTAAAEFLRYTNIAVLLLLAAVAAYRWRGGGAGAGWLAAAFGALTMIFAFRIVVLALGDGDLHGWQLKLLVAIAAVFPYFLFRFSASLQPASRRIETAVGALVVLVLAVTVALPEIPLDEDVRPAWFYAYLVFVLAEWAVLLSIVSARLWAGGRGQPRLARHRMRALALAAAALVVAVILAAFGPAERSTGLDIGFRLLVLASVLAFFVAFAPPRVVREFWRRPEQDRAQQATQALIAATAVEDVVASVLPAMARLVGADAVALLDKDDRVVGSYGAEATAITEVGEGQKPAAPKRESREPLRVPLPNGSVLVWASPYAPVFGEDELELLRTLGALAELALERAGLFDRERQAREILEQADELKSGFIALAAHELRSPAATLYGLAELLHLKPDAVPPERQPEFRRHLYEEASRLVRLLDELLDLSRLEAGAIEIAPRPLRVREQLDRLLPSIAGDQAPDVAIEVNPSLETVIDPSALERIVTNLITNALRYGEPPVRVTAKQSDRHFRLSVEDCGPGVSPEFIPRLFDRFARSTEAKSTPGGTGLGLAIAQSYAHAHGATILYHDVRPHGAHFEFVLPQSGKGDGQGERIAIRDDR